MVGCKTLPLKLDWCVQEWTLSLGRKARPKPFEWYLGSLNRRIKGNVVKVMFHGRHCAGLCQTRWWPDMLDHAVISTHSFGLLLTWECSPQVYSSFDFILTFLCCCYVWSGSDCWLTCCRNGPFSVTSSDLCCYDNTKDNQERFIVLTESWVTYWDLFI